MDTTEKQKPGPKPYPRQAKLVQRSVMLEPEIADYLQGMEYGSNALMRQAITAAVKREMKRKEQADVKDLS